jgi:toxin ParE1/3/4
MTVSVQWTKDARLDLIRIIKYISFDSKTAAKKIYVRIKKETSHLKTHPEKFRVVPELYESGIKAYREVIVVPYRIVYKIMDATVVVIAIIDSRQDLETFLFGRIF